MLVEATFLTPDFLLVLLLGFVLRLFIERFSSLSGLDGRERENGDPFDEYSVLSKLRRVIVGRTHTPNINEMIARNATADSDANKMGKRDTRPRMP